MDGGGGTGTSGRKVTCPGWEGGGSGMELSGLVDWRRRPRPDSCGAGLGCSRKGTADLRGLSEGPCLPRSLFAAAFGRAQPAPLLCARSTVDPDSTIRDKNCFKCSPCFSSLKFFNVFVIIPVLREETEVRGTVK